MHCDAHRHDTGDLTVKHLPRQTVGGYAVTHQSTQFRLGLVDRDGIAQASQLVGSGQTRGTAANDGDMATLSRRRALKRPAVRQRLVAHKALQLADGQCLVIASAVAGRLTRVVADTTSDRREWVVPRQHLPGGLKVTRTGQANPLRNVAVDRAGGVAGSGGQNVLGQGRAPSAGLDGVGTSGGPDGRDRCGHGPWHWRVHAALPISCRSAQR